MTRHLADLGTTNPYHEVGFGLVGQFYDAMDKRVRLIRLQLAPTLDLGLVTVFRKALEILRGQLSRGRALPREFSRMKGSRGIGSLPRKETAPALGEPEAVMELADTVPGEVFSCDRDR